MDKEQDIYYIFNDNTTSSSDDEEFNSYIDDYNKNILSILGEDKYKKYKEFEKTTPQRYTVLDFNEHIDAANRLNKDQINELILVMSQIENKYFKSEYIGESLMISTSSAPSDETLPEEQKIALIKN